MTLYIANGEAKEVNVFPNHATNYDRVMRMSVEELAKEFAKVAVKTIDALMEAYRIEEYEVDFEEFAACWLEWLNMEVQNDTR